jgi:lysozyme
MTYAISPKGLALIRKYEGFRSRPTQLPDCRWVVGFGHVCAEDPGPDLTRDAAHNLLVADLAPIERVINDAVTQPLTQSQYDVLVSLAFSIGAGAFLNSQVLRRINAGQFVAAACAIEAWRKIDVEGHEEISAALVCRRAVEKAIFLKEIADVAAPSPILRPRCDHAALILDTPGRCLVALTPTAAPEPTTQAVAANPGARLTEILRADPATAALLSAPAISEMVDEHEIITAHARPSPRALGAGPEPLPIDRRTHAAANQAGGAPDSIGPAAIFLFGLALALAGVSQWLVDRLALIDLAAGALLFFAGAAAIAAAAPALRRAVQRQPRQPA